MPIPNGGRSFVVLVALVALVEGLVEVGLRRKALLVLSGVAVVLVVTLAVAVTIVFGRLTRELERAAMIEATDHVEREFTSQLDAMLATANDYAHWDETRDYLAGTRPRWPESNMQQNGLVSLGMDGEIVYDRAGVPVNSLLLGADGEPVRDPTANVLDPATAAVLQVRTVDGAGGGFWLRRDGGVSLVRSAAVTNDDVTEGPFGTVAFLRAVDDELLSLISTKLSLDVQVRSLPSSATLPAPGTVAVRALDRSTNEAVTALPVVNSDRKVALVVREKRALAATASRAGWVAAIALILAGMVVIALVVFLIDRIVLRRLERLSADVRRVAESGDPSERVAVDGSDEIAQVAIDTNSMLSSIARTQDDLRTATVGLARAKAAADTANESKTVFLSTMSHEIRTPINGVIGLLTLALRTELTDEQRDLLETAHTSAMSLTQLVGDYLDLSKIESGRLVLDPQPCDMRELFDAVASEFRYQADHAGVELTFDVADDTPRQVIADAVRIRQVLVNLVGNALKFTPEGGTVAVRVAAAPDAGPGGVSVAVADTGPGIAAENLSRIFDPYDQIDGSTSRDHGGTGLGLTITRRIVDVMNGTIDVQSAPGEGSTFTVRLPLSLQPSSTADDS